MRTCGWCLELSVFFPCVLRFLPRLTVPLPALPDVHLSVQREVHVQPNVRLQLGERGHFRLRHTPHSVPLGCSMNRTQISPSVFGEHDLQDLENIGFFKPKIANTITSDPTGYVDDVRARQWGCSPTRQSRRWPRYEQRVASARVVPSDEVEDGAFFSTGPEGESEEDLWAGAGFDEGERRYAWAGAWGGS